MKSTHAGRLDRSSAPSPGAASVDRSRTETDARLRWLREYAETRIDVADSDSLSRLSPALVLDLGAQGLFGPHLPREVGGLELLVQDTLRLIEQVASIDVTLASFLVGHYTSTLPLSAFGSDAMKGSLLPLLAQGQKLAAFALTEPGAGSNPRALEATALEAGEQRWRLQGQKSYIGNAAWAGVLTLFVRHRGGAHRGISAFAVPRGRSGLLIGAEAKTLGVRAMMQSTVLLKDVPVTRADLLGEPGQGLQVAEHALRLGRLAIGAMSLGAMRRCAQVMLRYASRREIATGLLLRNPVTRERLTEVDAAITAVEALVTLIAGAVDRGEEVPDEAFLACKVAGSELAWRVADAAVQLLGARGYEECNLVPKILRDVRFLRIGEGPTESLLMQLGAAISAREPALRTFITERAARPELFERLLLAESQLREHSCSDPDEAVSLQRRCYHLGQLGVLAFLEVALLLRSTEPGGTEHGALAWVRAESARALFAATAAAPSAGDGELTRRIDGYASHIGELDETMGAAWQSADPLLRNEKRAKEEESSEAQVEPAPSPVHTESPAPPHPEPVAEPLELGVDFPVDRAFRDTGAPSGVTTDALSGAELVALADLGTAAQVGSADILLAAFVAFLSRFANAEDLGLLAQDPGGTRGLHLTLEEGASFRDLVLQIGAARRRLPTLPRSAGEVAREHLLRHEERGHSVVPRLVSGGIRVCFVWLAEDPEPVSEALLGLDLTLITRRSEGQLVLSLRYDALLFEGATARRRMQNFRELLRAALSTPDQPVRALNLLPEDERQQVVHGWNGPTTDGAYFERCVHELIEEQVLRTPQGVAVQTPAETLSYSELELRANQLAACLIAHGIGPGSVVAVATGRTAALVVGALGTLKAGAAFLPLNCSHPTERLHWMITEARAAAVVVERTTAGLFAQIDPIVISVDGPSEGSASPESFPSTRPALRNTPQDPAYVIFTSGSTGRPKGTVVPHAALCNEMLWRRDAFALDERDRALQTAAPNFDIAVWEMLGPLGHGGRIVLGGGPAFVWDAAEIVRLINEYEITTIQIVPSQLAVLLGHMHGDDCRSIRLVVCGGESLPKNLQLRFFATAARGLHNFYGPTEATIEATVWRCDPDDPSPTAPIGSATTNRRVYVLDEQLQPVPIGVSGELFIAGAGLATGYLHQPELTTQRFLPDPFVPGGRMYRSGDRVYYRPDGALVFVGRMDRQLKVRGVRIEPGEIETVLASHPALDQCVVDLQQAAPGDKRLVCYATALAGQEPAVSALREYAQQRLPRELVPSAFVILKTLPRTGTGKVDLKALPRVDWGALGGAERPRGASPTPHSTTQPPGSPAPDSIAESIALLYRQILGCEVADDGADFFELGGHSLLALQLLSRVREQWGIAVALRDFFAAPTVRALAARIAESREQSADASQEELVRIPRQHALPLLPSQERLAFLQHLAPHSAAYNVPEAVRLRGPLSTEHLEIALREIMRRHEALRTRFTTQSGCPVQVILDEGAAELPLRIVPLNEADLQSAIEAEAGRPFTLAEELPFRVMLFRLSDTEHVLLWVLHHIAADGWSAGAIFVRELSQSYTACVQGRPLAAAMPVAQLVDYAAWQERRLTPQKMEHHRSYWRSALSGAPTQLALPLDHPRPSAPSFAGARVYFDLPPAEAEPLRELARREGVTLFSILLSAFEILLHSYSGQEDFLVGTAIAGRYHPAIESIIGNFASTVALRARFPQGTTIRELIRGAHEQILGAVEHGAFPFEQIVEELNPERSLGTNPLFQVALTLYNGALHELALPGLAAEWLRFDPGIAKFDLMLALLDGAQSGEDRGMRGGLSGHVEYSTELFERSTIERMLGHYLTILRILVRDPEQRASAAGFLSPAERRMLTEEWQGGPLSPGLHPACVHTLFEEQVERTPERTAAIGGERSFTYRELNERANQLAGFLLRAGIGPETLVGLCVERSLEMLVGMLGILKAGGAYLPLDPAYPTERLAYTLQDAQVSLVVTDTRGSSVLPQITGLRSVRIDTDWELIAREPTQKPQTRTTPESLCYVIYTSGSTGRPKGVAVEHRGVGVLVKWSERILAEEDLGRALASTSICFDVSVWELFVPLCRGGTLIVVENILKLLELPHAGVTIINVVPSAAVEVLRLGALPGSIRTVISGGEYLPCSLVQKFYETGTVARVIDMYGPTETTVFSTWALRRPGEAASIGRPLPGTEVYLLNREGQLVPPGAAGELHIGGIGVARGYLNRSELTQQRFIRSPFRPTWADDSDASARIYRTGDLARHLPDGRIEYLGRIDQQVKIRGFRIELGEIEATLRAHPAVREAVVLLREDASGDKRLIAYLVPGGPVRAAGIQTQDPISISELRSFLRTRLPEYMVPSAFISLPELPLLPNGKVNKHRLRELEIPADSTVAAPRDSLESTLLELWEELLQQRIPSVDCSFFEAGGHSLLALQLLARIEQRLGVRLPLSALYEAGSVAGLAARLRAGAARPGVLFQLRRGPDLPPLFLVHPISGLAVCYHELAQSIDRPVYGLQARALSDPDAAAGAPTDLASLSAEYVQAVRAVFTQRTQGGPGPHGPYLLGGWSLGGVLAFEMARQLEAMGEPVAAVILFDSMVPQQEVRSLDAATILLLFLRELSQRFGKEAQLDAASLAALPPERRMDAVLAEAKRIGGLPVDAEATELERMLAFCESAMSAYKAYVPQPIRAPVILFRAEDQRHYEELRVDPRQPLPLDLGWSPYAMGGLTTHAAPGEHMSLIFGEHAGALGARLAEYLRSTLS